MTRIINTFILSLLCISFCWTQTCCSGGVPVSSNLGFQSSTKGNLQLSIGVNFNVLKNLKDGSNSLDDDVRLRTTQSLIFRGAYALSERASLEALLPLVRQTRRIRTLAGDFDKESTFGLGDPVLLFIYDVIQSNPSIRLGMGPQFPLGSTTQKNKLGLALLEDLQPGSGAWDIISFASIEYGLPMSPSSVLYANFILSKTGVNKSARGGTQTYEFGDDFQIIAGYSDQIFLFNQVMNPSLSARFRSAERDQVSQSELPGTGGDFLFLRLSNGIELPNSNSRVTLNLEIPLWVKVNETQLAPSYVINLAWHKTFEKKKEIENLIDTF